MDPERLLHCLKHLQDDDAPTTNPMIFAIKYSLSPWPKCCYAIFNQDRFYPDILIPTTRAEMPEIILSQLDAQRLANRNEPTFQNWLPLHILIKILPTDKQDFRFPTLFRWYCRPRHRTYYLFSFLSVNMIGAQYTIQELMGLRTQGARGILPENPEVAEIVRDRRSESTGGTCKPSNSSKKNDSSESSEEILFKGNKDRRANREARDAAVRQTVARQMAALHDPAPTHATARELVAQPVPEPAREPASEPAPEPARESAQNPSQTGWKYRGRSDSEAGNVEPKPGPAGVPAQKNEGFQRFYKAVISPTHVRVTAGGRIVPNTRGPPSPTSRRTKDNSTMDAPAVRDQTPQINPPLGQMGMHQPVAVWPQLVGYPGNLQALQGPLPVIPMQFGHPGYQFPVLQPAVPQPVMGRAATNQPGTDSTSKEVGNTDSRAENSPVTEIQDKVQITSPENFDRTKPFYLNGQLVYPVTAGFPGHMGNPMMPVQMVGLPGIPPNLSPGMTSQFPGHVMPVPPQGTGQIIAGPFPPGQTFPGIPTMASRVAPVIGNNQTHVTPPASSIKKSEVTKKQIGTLKSSIKWCEDQLQYNRFQIDENNMRETLRKFEAERQLFEARYRTELAEEEAVARSGTSQNKTVQDENTVGHGSDANLQSVELLVTQQSSHQMDNLSTKMSQLDIGQSTRAPKGDLAHKQWAPVFDEKGKGYASTSPHGQLSDGLMESKKLGLPMDAALAPPFMPRGFAGEVAERSVESREAANEYFGIRQRRESRDSTRGKPEIPYLLGALPSGVNPRTARDQDYVYNRPLNDDEVRARYLYWGKAPKSVMQGLPKFDGKHFYPPSPIKEDATLSDEGATAHRVPTSRRPVNYDFRGTKSDCDPFRPMTPTQQCESSKAMFVSEDGYVTGNHARTTSMETEIYIPTQDMTRGGQTESTAFGATTGMSATNEEGQAFTSASTTEKRPEKGALWPKLKKSATSSALSSTTAQGYLPQYSGYAAASLSPSMNKNLASPIREIVAGKHLGLGDRIDGGSLISPSAEKRGENLPPNPVSSLGDQSKHVSLADPHRRDVGANFKI